HTHMRYNCHDPESRCRHQLLRLNAAPLLRERKKIHVLVPDPHINVSPSVPPPAKAPEHPWPVSDPNGNVPVRHRTGLFPVFAGSCFPASTPPSSARAA